MFTELLNKALSDNNLALTKHQIQLLLSYLELLNKWNKTYNLTAINNPEEQIYKHVIDSLSITPYLQGNRVLDVGTGSGLPGIPLSIYFSDKQFVLVDCSLKRINFLQHVIRTLKLTNVQATHQRIESAQTKDFGTEFTNGFDTIVSRAFSATQNFIALAGHLLAKNGQLLAMKGTYPKDEVAQIPQDFCIESVRELSIIGLQAERHCISIKKR